MIKDVTKILSGQLIAQAINFAALPVLAYLYKPEAFGVFAVLSAIALIYAVVATLQAEHLILTLKTKQAARALAFIIIFVTGIFSIFFVAGVELIFSNWFYSISGTTNNLSILLGFTIFFAGCNQALRFYATYTGRFSAHGMSEILAVLGRVIIPIVYATKIDLQADFLGLVLGQVTGLLLSLLPFFYYTDILHSHKNNLFKEASVIISTLYKKIPFLVVTHLSKRIYDRIQVLLVESIGGSASAGAFAMAERIINVPTALFGYSIGNVFKHRFKLVVDNPEENKIMPRKLITITFLLVIIPYVTLILLSDWLVSTLLGEDWLGAIIYVKIIATIGMFNFVFFSVEGVAIMRGIFVYRMYWQVSQIIAMGGVYLFIMLLDLPITVTWFVAIIALIRIVFVCYDIVRIWTNKIDIEWKKNKV